jgi:Tol biopolymer transport system component
MPRTFAISGRAKTLICVLIALTACGGAQSLTGTDEPPIPVATSVTLSVTTLTFASLGESQQLTATVHNQAGDVMSGAPVVWSSLNPQVAVVSEAAGIVRALRTGSTTVVATSGSASTSATATVEQLPASVTLSAAQITFGSLGDTTRIDATVHDALGAEIPGVTAAWASSNPQVSTVDPVGLVTAIGNGATEIKASVEGHSAAASVLVDALWGKIAFSTERVSRTYPQIYVMEAVGSNPVALTNTQWENVQPAWAPDGSMLAWEAHDAGAGIWVMNSDGSDPVRLADGQAPNWSPDGSQIAYAWIGGIYVMEADGSNQTEVIGFGSDPTWSPDGTRLAFVHTPECQSCASVGTDVFVVNADGTNVTNLTNDPAGDQSPAWSPDGAKIAFHSYRDGNYEVYVMAADGSSPTNLTNAPGSDRNPAWSPDGSRIAFDTDRNRWARDYNVEIYVMNPDGSNQVRLTDQPYPDRSPAWSR